MTNPDGVTIAQAMDPNWKSNANGVDLNRNFPTFWEISAGAKAPGAAKFKGFAPASEPETLALMSFAGSRNFSCYINYHMQGNIIYYYSGFASPTTNALSTALAKTVSAINGYPLINDSGSSSEPVFGSFGDLVLVTLGKPGITVECGSAYGAKGQGQCGTIFLRNADSWAAAARLFNQ